MVLNVNTDALVQYTAKLERINKSALPVAVRQTLTKAAYDVKTDTMPSESDVFIHRKPTFFKANSKVVAAKGFDVEHMEATVGFIPKEDTLDSSVNDLEQQEHGGVIKGRSFIPLPLNRVGNSWLGNVRKAGRIRAVMDKIIDSKDSSAKTDEAKFRATVKHGGVGSFVIGNRLTKKGNWVVWEVLSDKKMKLVPRFVVKGDREVSPPATHFMEKASLRSADKMEAFFIALAERKIYSA